MELIAQTPVVTAVLLVAVRVGALLVLTPLLAMGGIPASVRVLLTLGLSLVLVLSLGVVPQSTPTSLGALAEAVVREALIGAMLAFGVFAAFGAFLFGGRILDLQIGFGVANLIDPATNVQGPLIGTVLGMMAVMTFFLLDGHHLLIRGLAFSLRQVPPGAALPVLSPAPLLAQFGLMFSLGFALVAPAVLTLLLVDVGMSVAARTMPQMNMFIVGLPLKIFVGLAVLALSLGYMSPLLARVFASIFRFWSDVLSPPVT